MSRYMHCWSKSTACSALALFAGIITLSSSVPEIYQNFLDPLRGSSQSLERSLLQGAGNLAWLAFSTLKSIREMQIMSSLGVSAAAILMVQQITADAYAGG